VFSWCNWLCQQIRAMKRGKTQSLLLGSLGRLSLICPEIPIPVHSLYVVSLSLCGCPPLPLCALAHVWPSGMSHGQSTEGVKGLSLTQDPIFLSWCQKGSVCKAQGWSASWWLTLGLTLPGSSSSPFPVSHRALAVL
jgi:hypothetical protein